MSEKITALIAEARTEADRWPDGIWQHDLVTRLADALEASVQAPAVDREALARAIHDVDYYGLNVGEKITLRSYETADALLASGVLQERQAPAVDREAVADRIAQSLALAEGQAFAPKGGRAWKSAEGLVTTLFASDILQDAAELEREAEARGLENEAERFWARDELGRGNGRAVNAYQVAEALRARAAAIREGRA